MASSFTQSIFKWLAHGRSPANEILELACTSDGRLMIDATGANRTVSYWVYPSSTSILVQKRVIDNKQNYLLQMIATNEGTTQTWFMIFDSTTLPINSAIPKFSFPVTAKSTVGMDQTRAIQFIYGIAWAISTTSDVLTLPTDLQQKYRVTCEVLNSPTPG